MDHTDEDGERADQRVGRVFVSSVGLSVLFLAIMISCLALWTVLKPSRAIPTPTAVSADQRSAVDSYVKEAVLRIERVAAANYSATLKEMAGEVRLSIAIYPNGFQRSQRASAIAGWFTSPERSRS